MLAASDTLYAVILGIIQGITEFLPISSSAHLIIVSYFLNGHALPLSLNIALHVGTLLAVLIYFWRDWLDLLISLWDTARTGRGNFGSQVLLPSLIIGSIPAGIIGVLWQDDIEANLHNPISTVIPLIIVGIGLWWMDKRCKSTKTIRQISYKNAFLIGIAQAFALIPGVSRSGSTIMCARALGYKRDDAARFSFLLGTPAMLGASLLNASDIIKSLKEPAFYTGCGVATLVGILAIHFLLGFIKRFGFGAFAIYRCLLAALIIYLMVL